ncbi:hypothetical protein FFLO_04867 [Filobasidium floriforme]|uniref:Uncharacterized protein n=1 Tax=Filobasidium floriforme TaxID=5210 RepID=A0A8K0JJC5_9TREE|nr:uncharacterized protein HD553DRAFT_327130 [Filobasidium floriforme]KAG7530697.1 hypothetical protein FFLO_04867 [Filobasidium floriforme]KAH8077802.1 hypothetical protein HD553DRAFT_327130 [Filobasidium floriforme]
MTSISSGKWPMHDRLPTYKSQKAAQHTEFAVDSLEELGEDTGRSPSEAAKIVKASVLYELQTLKAQAAAVAPSAIVALASGVATVEDSTFYTADPDTNTINSTIKWSSSGLQVLLVLTTDCMIGVVVLVGTVSQGPLPLPRAPIVLFIHFVSIILLVALSMQDHNHLSQSLYFRVILQQRNSSLNQRAYKGRGDKG